MNRLDGKVALITGGASGIGKAIARRLTAEGARVVITDRDAATGALAAEEVGGEFLSQDVTDEARWSAVVSEVQARHRGLHVLVNNAGILGDMSRVSPQATSLADWRRVFAVNVESVLLGCQAAIPLMAASGGGSIINMSSVAGLLATPYATAYGASKATMRQLTKTIAQHCAEQQLAIRCNSVHPGIVRTPLWDTQAGESAERRGVSFERMLAEVRAGIPLGEFQGAEDVAATVAFLASEDSRWITGDKFVVDGGRIHCDTFRPRPVAASGTKP